MTKLRLTLILFCTSLLLAPHNAQADIEAMQMVLGFVRGTQEEIEYYQDQMAQAQELIRTASEGVGNAVQKVNSVRENPLGVGEELLNQTVSDITNINDPIKALTEVTGSYNSDPAKGNTIQVIDAQREKMYAIQRENLANLYAVAFTTRSILARGREKPEPKNDFKDSREMVKLTNEKALEMAQRMRNVMKLETATYEFNTTQEAIGYMNSPQESDEDATPQGGEK